MFGDAPNQGGANGTNFPQVVIIDPPDTPVTNGTIQAAVWTKYGRLVRDNSAFAAYSVARLAGADEGASVSAPGRVLEQRTDVSRLRDTALPRFALVYTLIRQWGGWDPETMMRIGACESGLQNIRSHNVNYDGLYDWGWPQIHGEPEALDPLYATERAYEKFQAARERGGTGYEPWVSSIRCWG